MRISDWSSDVCSSDLKQPRDIVAQHELVDRLVLKTAANEDHPRAPKKFAHDREVEIGAAEKVEHRHVVVIGQAAGGRAVDIGFVREEEDRKSTRLNSSN